MRSDVPTFPPKGPGTPFAWTPDADFPGTAGGIWVGIPIRGNSTMPESKTRRRPGVGHEGEEPQAPRFRVLVVQQDGTDAATLERLLQDGGLHPFVKQVPDADVLRYVLRREPWHLIVADADDADPERVLDAVRTARPGVEVILVAREVGHREILRGLQAGACDVIARDRLGHVLTTAQQIRLMDRMEQVRNRVHEALTLHGRAVEAAGLGLIIADMRQPGLPVVYGNPAFEAITGLRPEEYLGHRLGDLQGLRTHAVDLQALQQALRRGASCRITLEKRRPDGSTAWSDLMLSPLRDRRGQVTHAVGLQSETRYRAIVEDQAEYVCRFRPDGTLTFANQAYGRMMGRDPEALIGANFLDWLPPEERERFLHHLASFTPEQPLRSFEHQVRMPDDSIRWLHWTDRALFDEDGVLVEFQSTGWDITERKQAEQEQAHLIEELDAFAHTVAHDLKSPLMTLIGFADVLERDIEMLTPEQLREFAGHIGRYARKMNNLIDELMLLANVRRAGVTTAPLDMGGIVAEALQRLGYLLDEHKPVLTQPETWPVAVGYTPWVVEVWVNYISNAIKYGGRPPHVTLGAEVQGDGWVRFWVRDNGDGLSPEAKSRLFLPFERLEQVKAGGQGLGLSIVRRIVDRLGGTVGVRSEGAAGRGSEFSFTLPALAPHGDAGPWSGAPGGLRPGLA
ncbi:MAG: PAS domain S-box protein [Bacteroidetes bacterium]|nr:MAG: PAS domain S-box protein [Bacteroidota bacterium]